MGDKKKSKSGSKSDSSKSSRKSRGDKSDSSSKSKKSRSKSRDGHASDSSSKSKSKKEKSSAPKESTMTSEINPLSASMEFEAGMFFSKYDKENSGRIDKAQFVQMFREMDAARASGKATSSDISSSARPPLIPQSFKAGELFEKYTQNNNGRGMSMQEFERFVSDNNSGIHRGIAWGAPKGVKFNENIDNTGNVINNDNNIPVSFTAGLMWPNKGSQTMSKGEFESLVNQLQVTGKTDFYDDFTGGTATKKADKPELTHFNETTGVPLTSDAAKAHVATGQSVTTLEKAYGKRLGNLSAMAAQHLAPRREQLSQLRHLILQRSDEIKSVTDSIIKETTADADNIIDRLKAAETLKQAALQQQLNECSAELESVDHLVAKITAGSEAAAVTSNLSNYRHLSGRDGGVRSSLDGEIGMVGFIQLYPELSSAIDRLVARQINVNVDLVSDDLPREMAERNEVVRKCDRYEQALAVKDQMLWNMLKEKESWDEKIAKEREINKEYANEMSEWLALTNNMSEEINRIRDEHVEDKRALLEDNENLRSELAQLKSRMSLV